MKKEKEEEKMVMMMMINMIKWMTLIEKKERSRKEKIMEKDEDVNDDSNEIRKK